MLNSDLETLQAQEDLLYGKSSLPGRGRSYLANQEEGHDDLLPYSCKLRVYDNNLPYELQRTSKDLRWGAGVKLVLDDYQSPAPCGGNIEWKFMLDPDHPDYGKITEHQKTFLYDPSEFPIDKWVTTFSVGDYMEGESIYPDEGGSTHSIENSWEVLWNVLYCREVDLVVINLNNLRPYGQQNGRGLTSTGPVGDGTEGSNLSSFLAIYEYIAIYAQNPTITNFIKLFGVLNNTIRRGGIYKNGIVCSSMWWEHPCIKEYLSSPLADIAGSHKKAIGLNPSVLADQELTDLILEKTMNESLFLEKRELGDSFFPNVCVGLGVPHDGTCLIWRVNFGMCEGPEDIIEAYKQTAHNLTNLHISWRKNHPEKAKYSAPLEEDRQIGLDVMGLANYLALHNISYEDFVKAVYHVLYNTVVVDNDDAVALVKAIIKGQEEAIKICDQITDNAGLPPLYRIFCVEPAQSHSYETFDLSGKTTCRGIWPPVGRKVTFESATRQNRTVLHGKVETVGSVSLEFWEHIHMAYQLLLNDSGRAHFISYDLRQEPTQSWFENFLLYSPLKNKYYTEIKSTDQSHLDKVIKEVNGGCAVCAE